MNKVLFYIEKYKIIIILITVILAISIFYVLNNKKEKKEEIVLNDNVVSKIEEISTIKVDIKGLVENSGVYELDTNSRVIDAIDAAGGLLENANTEYLNLSKKLKDGDVIIVYSNDYISSLKKEKVVYIELPCECPDNINNACITNEIVNEEINNEKDSLISINTGSKEELMTLPGIGESKAIAIVKYREENNGFSSLEDIMKVSGIGEAAYSKIKDYIKL